MDLSLDPSVAAGLKSRSQIARRVTEAWASANLFCLSCSSERLQTEDANTRVRDFSCPQCAATYQLKAKGGRHGNTVANSAYGTKIAAIRRGNAPNYAFLDYTAETWKVTGLFIVPGHFLTEGLVQRRKPLPPTARRAGWVGSNILLSRLPAEGRIAVVSNGVPIPPDTVRQVWDRFRFLKTDSRASSGWGAEILTLVRGLQAETGTPDFTLQTFYRRFRVELTASHPDNHNIDAKIRQQLQVLRDGGILQFLGRGRYRIVG